MKADKKYMKIIKSLILGTLFLITPLKGICMGAFYNSDDKKGFYWYEEFISELKEETKKKYVIPTPEEAHQSLESRKQELDAARDQMHAIGYDPNSSEEALLASIKKYKELEEKMWDGAERIVAANNMVNFIYPELLDNLNEPTNVYGVKIQKKLTAKEDEAKIKEFAKEYDLILFASETCAYCHAFLPVFDDVVTDYNFTHEVTNLSSEAGHMARKLGVDSVPTLIAVKKDGSNAFEISRGMISGSELKDNLILGLQYSKSQSKLNQRIRR